MISKNSQIENYKKGGRHISAIDHIPELNIYGKSLLHFFASRCDFRCNFLEEKTYFIADIATKTGMSRRSVINYLKILEEKKYIKRKQNFIKRKGTRGEEQTATSYALTLDLLKQLEIITCKKQCAPPALPSAPPAHYIPSYNIINKDINKLHLYTSNIHYDQSPDQPEEREDEYEFIFSLFEENNLKVVNSKSERIKFKTNAETFGRDIKWIREEIRRISDNAFQRKTFKSAKWIFYKKRRKMEEAKFIRRLLENYPYIKNNYTKALNELNQMPSKTTGGKLFIDPWTENELEIYLQNFVV